MCIISKESSKSPNIYPIETVSSPVNFDAPRLSSGSICSITSVDDNYFKEDTIKFVTDFGNIRDIKSEIVPETKSYLSQGAFGIVSSARLLDGSMVAIKESREEKYREHYEEDYINTRKWNEVANCIRLKDNSSFVELLGIYINDINNPCLSMAMVMECADGDLYAYSEAIEENPDVQLSHPMMQYIAHGFVKILEACREAKINYPDFHLGNVLVFYAGRKLKLADFDGIQPLVDNSDTIYEALFELLEFSCNNYGKSKQGLFHTKRSPTFDKETLKYHLANFLGGDYILANILLEPIMAYKEQRLQGKINSLEDIIDQFARIKLEEFPALKMSNS
jgi:hypothetical protein